MIDVTNWTSDMVDVFLAHVAGDDCIPLDKLTDSQIATVFAAMGMRPPSWYFNTLGTEVVSPEGFDYEGAILTEQERRYDCE